jgi:hypothetical protein
MANYITRQKRCPWCLVPPEPAYNVLAQACLSTLVCLKGWPDKSGLKKYPLALCAALLRTGWLVPGLVGMFPPQYELGFIQLVEATTFCLDLDPRRDKQSIEDFDETSMIASQSDTPCTMLRHAVSTA